jgi:hypothetical protein
LHYFKSMNIMRRILKILDDISICTPTADEPR